MSFVNETSQLLTGLILLHPNTNRDITHSGLLPVMITTGLSDSKTGFLKISNIFHEWYLSLYISCIK